VANLRDSFGRDITYLRLSVTDRCDLRCTYCMAEQMQFLPKRDLLTLEELATLSDAFIDRGVRKIRITGGEPLVRRDMMRLIAHLSAHLHHNRLDEVTLTSNGTQLEKFAYDLKSLGVNRVNISLDTLDDQKFNALTRRDQLSSVLKGIDAAQRVGLHVKINTVALKGINQTEIPTMIEWAHGRDMDLTLIEVMPLGEIDGDRIEQYLPLSIVMDELKAQWRLDPLEYKTGGPARYFNVAHTGGRLGIITPLTNNFCSGCNRVRVTCTGQIYMCLGHNDKLDLRAALRGANPHKALNSALDMAMQKKPERHDFSITQRGQKPSVSRHMSLTGG